MIWWINGALVFGGIVYCAWLAPFPLNAVLLAGIVWFATIDLRK